MDKAKFCSDSGIAQITAFVQRGQKREYFVSEPCVDGLSNSFVFTDLTPGLVRAGLEITGRTAPVKSDDNTSMTPGEPYCQVRMSERLVLSANHTAEIKLTLGGALNCDWGACETGEACRDGDDNDLDGFTDCSDPDCACPEVKRCASASPAAGSGGNTDMMSTCESAGTPALTMELQDASTP